MKILSISIRMPEKDKKGDQIVFYNRLKYLSSKGYEIVHILINHNFSKSYSKNSEEELKQFGIKIIKIKLNILESIINLILYSIFRGIPFQVSIFTSIFSRKKLYKLVNAFNPDLVYCCHIRPSLNLKFLKKPFCIELNDSVGLNLERRANNTKSFLKYLIKNEYKRVKKYERLISDQSILSNVVSKIDANYINSKKILIFPLGIYDTTLKKKLFPIIEKVIVFTGNLSYHPNNEAIMWFINNCWDKLLLKDSEIVLRVAGRDPSNDLIKLINSKKNIKLMANVKDIFEVLDNSTIAIAPMQSGSGMQFKILEAMSRHIPVVTNKLGIGDIKAENGRDIVSVEGKDHFVNDLYKLLMDKKKQEQIAANAYNNVIRNISWGNINSEFEKCLLERLNNH